MKPWIVALALLGAVTQTHAQTIPAWPTITHNQVQPTDLFQINGPRFVYNTFLTGPELSAYVAMTTGVVNPGTPGQIPFYAAAGSDLTAEGPFAAGLPIIGAGTSGLAAGAKTGITNTFAVTNGAFVNGHCRSTDSNLNEIDAGAPCSTGTGSGTVTAGLANQYAYYPSNGASVSGLQAPYLHSKVFGATGNGTTDDTSNLQTWLTACQTSGQACWLDPGTYKISAALSVTNSVTVIAPNFISASFAPVTTIDAIDVSTTNPVYFYNFGITYAAAANSGTAGISVTAPSGSNSSSIFRDLRILNPATGINFVNAAAYTVDNVKIEEFVGNAINIANASSGDTGDSTITSGYYAGAAGSNACAFWASSGGLKFNHNKCVTTANGFQVDLAAGVNTSQIIVTDNSFDGISSSAFLAARQSTTGSLVEVVFVGNTCSSALQCFTLGLDTTSGSWISGIQVSGNTYYSTNSGANVFAEFSSGVGITAVNNTLISNTPNTTAFICNGTAATATYGIFTKVGTFAANTNSCGATPITPN